MWRVVIRPYSLVATQIGLPDPDLRCFHHRSAEGALRRLGALIAGEQKHLAPTTSRVNQNIPVEQARTQVQQYEQQYRQTAEQAKQQATRAAEATREAVSHGALFGAIGLLLGAIAGWFGGRRMGAVEPTLTSRMGLSPIASGPMRRG